MQAVAPALQGQVFSVISSSDLPREGRVQRARGSWSSAQPGVRERAPASLSMPRTPLPARLPVHGPASGSQRLGLDRMGRLWERKRPASDRGPGTPSSRPCAWPWRIDAPRASGNRAAGSRPRYLRAGPTTVPTRRTGSGKWRSRAASELHANRDRKANSGQSSADPVCTNPLAVR